MLKARIEIEGAANLIVFALTTLEIERLLAGDVLRFDGDSLNPNQDEDKALTQGVNLVLAQADDVSTVYARVHEALGLEFGTS